ncbi:MAG: RnfABCDGE type electron transport complex subunit B [Ruminococcus sp.]|nr:RnfABCDGE type electron transport complex subunit B [Ruminococcus sp.]
MGIFAVLGAVSGVLLTFVSKVFAVQTDERLDAVSEALPQVNCGSCGYSGCADYAAAVIKGAPCNLCRPGGAAVSAKLSEIMGVEDKGAEKMHAFVRCAGDCSKAEHKYVFGGISSCAACNKFYNGSKACTSGCLGYGDCVKVCPEGAISIKDGIAAVDYDKCIGCGLCVKECPNHLIVLRPDRQKIEVACASSDPGKITRQLCASGCIGCGVCARACPKKTIRIIDNHAAIDSELCVSCGICKIKCPIGAIVKIR